MKKVALASAITASVFASSHVNATFFIFDWINAITAQAESVYDEIRHSEKVVQMMGVMSQDYAQNAADILAKQQRAASELSRASQVYVDKENMRRLEEQRSMPSETCGAAVGMAAVANSECTKPAISRIIVEANQRLSVGLPMSSSENTNGESAAEGGNNSGGSTTAQVIDRPALEKKLIAIYEDQWDRFTDDQKDSLFHDMYGTPAGKSVHPAAKQQVSIALKIMDNVEDYPDSNDAENKESNSNKGAEEGTQAQPTNETSSATASNSSSLNDLTKYEEAAVNFMGSGAYTLPLSDLESLNDYIAINFPPHLADLDSVNATAVLEKQKLDDLRALAAKAIIDTMVLSNVGELTSLDPDNAPSSYQAINEVVTEISSITDDGKSGLLSEGVSSNSASSYKTYAMTERLKLYLSYKELERSLREEAHLALKVINKLDDIEYDPYGNL